MQPLWQLCTYFYIFSSDEEYPDSLTDNDTIQESNQPFFVTNTVLSKDISEASNIDKVQVDTKEVTKDVTKDSKISLSTNDPKLIEREDDDKCDKGILEDTKHIDSHLFDERQPNINDAIEANLISENNVKNTQLANPNTVVPEFEDIPVSLLLADPPSGFKDSIADPFLSSSVSNQTAEILPSLQLKGSVDDISVGSESFDQAINKIADEQADSGDDDVEPAPYNSLPPNLSQVKSISSNLVTSHPETSSETTMPEQQLYKAGGGPSGPMKFSIAGYTERSSRESSYTDKLKLGRSDSSVSSNNSSLRYVNVKFQYMKLCLCNLF